MATKRKAMTARQAAMKAGWRSGLESTIAKQLELLGVEYKYEGLRLKYTVPASDHTYTPDFELPNGIIVETKGHWVLADRKKQLLVKQQHPDKDIRIVFSNSKTKIAKGSKTSYADFCNKHGIKFADKQIPKEWIDETGSN